MAKTFTLCLFVLITALSSFAQKINFNDTGNSWIICDLDPYAQMVDKYGNPIRPSYKRGIVKDTMWNGYTYYLHERYFGWIRNDSTGQKFYHRKHFDSTDKLFMDYTINVGDTLPYFNAILKSIDSVQINGVYHRLFDFNNAYILEGIGPNFGHSWMGEAQYQRVCCFMQHGVQAAVSPTPWFYYGCALSVNDIAANVHATVAPNPITANSRIILPHNITQGTFTITNALGQVIASREIINETELALPASLQAGIYFYRVSNTASEENYTGRFVTE